MGSSKHHFQLPVSRPVLSLSISLIVFCVFPVPAHSGTTVELGPLLTANIFSLNGDTPTDGKYKDRSGLGIGGVVDVYLRPDVAVSFQPMFTQHGTKVEFKKNFDGTELAADLDVRMEYFELPVLLKVTGTGRTRPYVTGGFGIGYLLDAEYRRNDESTNAKDSFKSTDYSIHFGIGVMFSIGAPSVLVEWRYSQGTRNIHGAEMSEIGVADLRSTGTQLFAGVSFPLGNR